MKNKNEFVKEFLIKLNEMPDKDRVKFVFLFGSYSQGSESKLSDFDICLYYDGDSKKRFNFRIKLMSKLSDKFDIQIFQDLPLYVRMSVLKGEVIYFDSEDFVYEKAYETIKKFEDFKKYYYDYINFEKIK